MVVKRRVMRYTMIIAKQHYLFNSQWFAFMAKSDFKNVGRNDPCPCGSGKKYKKCCMKERSRGFTAKVIKGNSGTDLQGLLQNAAEQIVTDQEAFEEKKRQKEQNGDHSA